jgi:hypothetical protein
MANLPHVEREQVQTRTKCVRKQTIRLDPVRRAQERDRVIDEQEYRRAGNDVIDEKPSCDDDRSA